MKKPYVVGIAGGTASGKTTLAATLEETLSELSVRVFNMDKYFKDKEDMPQVTSHVSGIVYADFNCPGTVDFPQLVKDLQSAIDGGEHDVVIIEGLLTLWEDCIYTLLDLKLFIDCQADERIIRRIKRSMATRSGATIDGITTIYLDMVRFRHDQYVEPSKWRADLILNGSIASDKALTIISEAIRSAVAQ